MCPAHSIATGAGTRKAVCGQEAKFKVKVMDNFSNLLVGLPIEKAPVIQAFLKPADQSIDLQVPCSIEADDGVVLGKSFFFSLC